MTTRVMRQLLSHLTLSEKVFHKLGPAVNSGTSIFIYGPPGNGKTSVARAIGNMILGQSIYIPYAMYVDGQVIKMFDNVNHVVADDEGTTHTGAGRLNRVKRDLRWVKIQTTFCGGWG